MPVSASPEHRHRSMPVSASPEQPKSPPRRVKTTSDFKPGDIHPFHDPSSEHFVKPARWCITREDLDEFEMKVYKAWEKGKIPNDPEFPNKHHDDPQIGPSLYAVNEHYIKRVTARKGGMSWALMKHPDGLACDVFATHAWAEGVFEFCTRVRSTWPPKAKHMYVCFLSNPQNSDISALLEGDVLNSPFVQALDSATHMVVVPNHKVSIYSRLWCVLEAFIAFKAVEQPQRNFSIMLPKPVHPVMVMILWTAGVLLGAGAFVIGYMVVGEHTQARPGMLVFVTFIVVSFVGTILRWFVEWLCNARNAVPYVIFFCYLEIVLQGLSIGLAYYQLHGKPDYDNLSTMLALHHAIHHASSEHLHQNRPGFLQGSTRHEPMEVDLKPVDQDAVTYDHHTAPPGTTEAMTIMMCMLFALYLNKIFIAMRRAVLLVEGDKLEFQSVLEAQCTSEYDEARIKDAVAGRESEVDNAIHTLKKVGKFDKDVKYNLDCGLPADLVQAGINPFKIAVGCWAWFFWYLADWSGVYHSLSIAITWLAFGTALALLLCLGIGERVIFASEVNLYFGVLFVIASHHPYFFYSRNQYGGFMDSRKLVLELCLLAAAIVVAICFYSKCFAFVIAKCNCFKTPPKPRALESLPVRPPSLPEIHHMGSGSKLMSKFDPRNPLMHQSSKSHLDVSSTSSEENLDHHEQPGHGPASSSTSKFVNGSTSHSVKSA